MSDSPNTDTVEEVELTEAEKELMLLVQHGEVFHKLLQFPRFQAFLQTNYDVEVVPSESTEPDGTILGNAGVKVRVIERNHAEVQLIQQKLLNDAQKKITIVNESVLKDDPKIIL
jgi:hypothetical protein